MVSDGRRLMTWANIQSPELTCFSSFSQFTETPPKGSTCIQACFRKASIQFIDTQLQVKGISTEIQSALN